MALPSNLLQSGRCESASNCGAGVLSPRAAITTNRYDGVRRVAAGANSLASESNGGFSSLVAFPASARLKPLAPVFPAHRTREPTTIRLPTGSSATIYVMPVRAFAAPRRRTFWKRQTGRLVAQEAFITQPHGSWARPGPSDNADRVPRLFDRSRRLRDYLRKLLCHYRLIASPIVASEAIAPLPAGCV
jgi:hypothetical protein